MENKRHYFLKKLVILFIYTKQYLQTIFYIYNMGRKYQYEIFPVFHLLSSNLASLKQLKKKKKKMMSKLLLIFLGQKTRIVDDGHITRGIASSNITNT